MKPDQERVKNLLTDTISMLCRNGLAYNDELKVEGTVMEPVSTNWHSGKKIINGPLTLSNKNNILCKNYILLAHLNTYKFHLLTIFCVVRLAHNTPEK